MLNLQISDLRAALICSADEQARPYLNSIFVETTANDGYLVSTDGHRMFVAHLVPDKNEVFPELKLIIPKGAVIDMLKALGKGKYITTLSLLPPDSSGSAQLVGYGMNRTFLPIDSQYPDWRRVIPQDADGNEKGTGQFDCAYLGDLRRIGNELRGDKSNPANDPRILHRGPDESALAVYGSFPHVIVVVMPKRIDVDSTPDWVKALAYAPTPEVETVEES